MESFCNVSASNVKYSINEHVVQIGIDEKNNKFILFDDENITENYNDVLRPYQNINDINYRQIGTLKNIFENVDNLTHIDNAKTISSKKFIGQFATIFKINEDKYSVRVYNPFNNVDLFETGVNPLQLKELLAKTISFRLSNLEINKLIEADISRVDAIHEKIQMQLDNVSKLKTEISKIDNLGRSLQKDQEIINLKNVLEKRVTKIEKSMAILKESLHDEMLELENENNIDVVLNGTAEKDTQYNNNSSMINIGDIVMYNGESTRIINFSDVTETVTLQFKSGRTQNVDVREIDLDSLSRNNTFDEFID